MQRRWAAEFYSHPPEARGCQICGLHFAKDSPEDQTRHRKFHTQVVDTFAPRPNPTLRRLFLQYGSFVPVRSSSPRWLRHRLYNVALMLQREQGYDFALWSEYGDDDGHGILVVGSDGRALGGAVVRWRRWSDRPDGWVLAWIWIAPPYRRQGWFRRTWETVSREFPGILPEPPYSVAAAAFIQGLEELPSEARDYAANIDRHGVEP
jgi:hypothetical protein